MLRLDTNELFRNVDAIIEKYENITIQGIYSRSTRYPITDSNKLQVINKNNEKTAFTYNLNNHPDMIEIIDEDGQLIATKDSLIKGMFSLTPFYSIIPAKILEFYIDILQVEINPKSHLYYRDDLNINTNQLVSVDENTDMKTVLKVFLPNTPTKVLEVIHDLYIDALESIIVKYMTEDPTSLYICDASGIYTTLSRDNLYAIRYKLMVRDSGVDEHKVSGEMEDRIESKTTSRTVTSFHHENIKEFFEHAYSNETGIMMFSDSPYAVLCNKGELSEVLLMAVDESVVTYYKVRKIIEGVIGEYNKYKEGRRRRHVSK